MIMQQLKGFYTQFLREPLWFKALILTTLLLSIVFSSSTFSEQGNYRSISKLAIAIFFVAYGVKLRGNRKVSIVFIFLALISIYLSWINLDFANIEH
ncbi:hypothetical protein C0Q44_02275 [Paenibacillus sp. PCH8]|nr:hypothetical protein C0Q44_02275 [Paenibacillus sp. PCH8]